MYVRWQSRARKRRGGSPLLTAVLVECRRIDGRPRQRTVAYLGSIREGGIESTLARLVKFWLGVTERLDQLGDAITPEERERIEAALAKRVRRVTNAEQAELNESLAGEARLIPSHYRHRAGARCSGARLS